MHNSLGVVWRVLALLCCGGCTAWAEAEADTRLAGRIEAIYADKSLSYQAILRNLSYELRTATLDRP